MLVEILVPTKIGFNHQGGCTKVERLMRYGSLKDKFAVGIIDKDRKDIPYLSEFTTSEPFALKELILWKHAQSRPHYIIQICPVLEKWIIDVCTETSIPLRDYGFETLDKLMAATKHGTALDNNNLKSLFTAIRTKQDYTPVRKLTNWIRLLRDKNYHADLNELKNA